MIDNSGYLTSTLVSSQLPEYISSDPTYQNLIRFLQIYYRWIEQNTTARDIPLLNDVDTTSPYFLEYFKQTFLPLFPKDALTDQTKLLKIARQLYTNKGIPDSFRFLFRAIYNVDVDIFFTKDAILKPSDGKWIVSKSVKLNTLDPIFLTIANLKVFGLYSKASASIESCGINGIFTELFLSNIFRSFQSGEPVKILDAQNHDVYQYGGALYTSNIPVGATLLTTNIISSIVGVDIDPNNLGLGYKVGDPVVFNGGLNTTIVSSPAIAQVTQVSTGSLTNISVINGSYGFQEYPNSSIDISNVSGNGASAIINFVDKSKPAFINYVTSNTINAVANVVLSSANYGFAFPNANANTRLIDALSFISLNTYPILLVKMLSAGNNYTTLPTITPHSLYTTDYGIADIASLGILAPIQIINGGTGYTNTDIINITGGSGFGAYANIANVDINGTITSINYIQNANNLCPLGGYGYSNKSLPTVSVTSGTGSNAVLQISTVLGDGAVLKATTDKIGQVQKVDVSYGGLGYISKPITSLRVMDLVVSSNQVSIPTSGDVIYQGASLAVSTFSAKIDSVYNYNSFQILRIFDYRGQLNVNNLLNVDFDGISSYIFTISNYNDSNYINGVRIYGDGNAKANSRFLDGIFTSSGIFLNSDGQLSSFPVLQSQIYNTFSYQLTAEAEYTKYAPVVKDIVHPAGMQLISRRLMTGNIATNILESNNEISIQPLSNYTNNVNSYITIALTGNTYSNVISIFGAANSAGYPTSLANTNLSSNMYLTIIPQYGSNITSKISTINSSNVVTNELIVLNYANVAYGYTNGNTIIISSSTNTFNVINNGIYSTNNALVDIFYPNNYVTISNNTQQLITSIDYSNGIIYVTNVLNNSGNASYPQLVGTIRNIITGNVFVTSSL